MRIVIILAAAALAGCAAAPQGPSAPAAAPVAAAKPVAPAAAAATKKTMAPPPGGITPELYAQAKEQGYQAKVFKSQTIFCRTEIPVGTRISKDSCVSVDQLENAVRQAEITRDEMRRGQTCGKSACGGS